MTFRQRVRDLVATPAAASRSLSFENGGPSHPFLEMGVTTSSGVAVTDDRALAQSAIWACVRILSETLAASPVELYLAATATANRQVVRNRPAWLDDPTPGQTWQDIISQTMISLLLRGNAYWLTIRAGDGHTGEILEMRVLHPDWITPSRIDETGMDRWQQFLGPDVRVGHVVYWYAGRPYPSTQVHHIPGMMKPGFIVGLSPIAYARETVGLAAAAQEYGSRLFDGDNLPSIAAEIPGAMNDEQRKMLREAYKAAHGGAKGAHQLAVLTENAKFTKLSINPDEAQFLGTRQFQIADCARFFGIAPHLLGDASGSTSWGSGLAEQGQATVVYSLRPWVYRLELAIKRLLLTGTNLPNATAYAVVNLDAVQRGTFQERVVAYQSALDYGWMTADEVRAREEMSPLPNGDGAAPRYQLRSITTKEREQGAAMVSLKTATGGK